MIWPLILFSAGGLALSAGAWMAWHPAGPMAAGVLLIFVAIRVAGTNAE